MLEDSVPTANDELLSFGSKTEVSLTHLGRITDTRLRGWAASLIEGGGKYSRVPTEGLEIFGELYYPAPVEARVLPGKSQIACHMRREDNHNPVLSGVLSLSELDRTELAQELRVTQIPPSLDIEPAPVTVFVAHPQELDTGAYAGLAPAVFYALCSAWWSAQERPS